MKFPKGATKEEKQFVKEEYIENLANSVIAHENLIKDILETIKNYRRTITVTKKHIRKYKALIKEAEKTKVD
jgi:hypothetical protein